MELQMCNIFEENDTLCNKQYNFIIIILIVIYSIFISVITSIIIFIKQPVENKEEELLLANYNTKDRALALQAAYKLNSKLPKTDARLKLVSKQTFK